MSLVDHPFHKVVMYPVVTMYYKEGSSCIVTFKRIEYTGRAIFELVSRIKGKINDLLIGLLNGMHAVFSVKPIIFDGGDGNSLLVIIAV